MPKSTSEFLREVAPHLTVIILVAAVTTLFRIEIHLRQPEIHKTTVENKDDFVHLIAEIVADEVEEQIPKQESLVRLETNVEWMVSKVGENAETLNLLRAEIRELSRNR